MVRASRSAPARRSLAAAVLLSVAGTAWGAWDDLPRLSFDEVEPGMRGTGRTAFRGTEIETFEVEILGKLPNIGPGQSLILGRCSGGPLAETGVLSGMSGSPVFVDDKLIGAVAYSWPFASEPIAGITPIEEMLAVADMDRPGARTARSGGGFDAPDPLGPLERPERIAAFIDDRLQVLLHGNGRVGPVSLPVSLGGFGAAGVERIAPALERAGFVPQQVGASGGAGAATKVSLEPGSPVGLKLVRGDLEMAATGTVTWVDGERVLAFGHPLFGLGAVDLPLTGARVEALLPSRQQSARIASPLAEVGALRQDRASGVFGRLAATPRMIPVRFQLARASGLEETFSFDIADDPALSPLLLYFSLNGILASRERGFGNATVRLREGSVIKMADSDDVALDNIFAGSTAFDYGTGIAAYVLHLLMNNTWSTPEIAGVNLLLEYSELPLTGRIRRASLDRYRARPGDEIEATVVVTPYRGRDETFTRRFLIPEETRPGRMTLEVGGAQTVARNDAQNEPVMPRDLGQLIQLINDLRRNDRVYLVANQEDTGVLLAGARLPNLPPSVMEVLSRPKSRGNVIQVPQRRVLEEVISTGYSVEGAARLEIEVVAP
jgi:hypothetical protein